MKRSDGGSVYWPAYLVTEDSLDTLDTAGLVLGQNLLDGVGNFPVLGSWLDGAESGLAGLVSSGEKSGADILHGLGGDDDATDCANTA